MEKVASEFDLVRAALDQYVIKELVTLIVTSNGIDGIADGAEKPAKRNLRKSHITRVFRDSLQPGGRSEVHSLIKTDLPSGHAQPTEANFVQYIVGKRMCMTQSDIIGSSRQLSPEAW